MPMKKIAVIGEILVEIMADTPGDGFDRPQPLTGPFPSGAPAIFASQAAKLGSPVALLSAVGDDDFGRLNTERLSADGVDISGVFVDRDRPTGSAFVRYDDQGGRRFVFNIRHSAAGHLHVTDKARSVLSSADHLHVMGSSLSSPDFVALNLETALAIRERGGTVSFDPNLRREMLTSPGLAEALERMISVTDLFLPSGDELTLLTDARTPAQAVTELLERGVTSIVHKRGAAGAIYHDANGAVSSARFRVDEVDPTGAGDCFGGAFTSLWLAGTPVDRALELASACGAIAVTRRGPMEGTATLQEIGTFIQTAERTT